MELNEKEKKDRGSLLREIRRAKGLVLTSLENKGIARGTIGNIEKGVGNVSDEKVKFYCALLGISFDDLPMLIEEKKEGDAKKRKELLSQLTRIEHVVDNVQDRSGLKMLKKIDVASYNLLNVVRFLEGKSYARLGDGNAARKFKKAIELSDSEDDENIPACAYNELSKISYYKNQFLDAVSYTDKGIENYNPNGKRKHIYYSLYTNKSLYLDKLDRTLEAEEILQKIWDEKDQINHMSVLLNLYDLRGGIYKKRNNYTEAVQVVEEGLELARINQDPFRSVELWTTLGSIYIDMNKLDQAEECLNIALRLKERLPKTYLFTTVFVKLGELYMQKGDFDLARKKLGMALKNKGKKANISKYVKALTFYGDCHLLQHDFEEPVKYYNEALALAEEHEFEHQQHEILRRLCIAFSNTDTKRYYEILDKYFRIDVKLNEKLGGVAQCMEINPTNDL